MFRRRLKREYLNSSTIAVLFLFVSLAFSVDKGMKEYKRNNFDEARKYYETVLEERRDDPAANFGLGVSAYQQGDIKSAMDAFGRIIRDDEQGLKAKSYYNMGNILYDQQRPEESLAFFKKALELDPDDTDAKFNYEILKYRLQSQKQNQQDDKGKDSDDQEESHQSNQEKQNSEEDKSRQQSEGEEKEKSKNNQGEKDQEQEKKEQEQQQRSETQKSEEERDNQDRMNAQAILDALKDEEKILQKRQIARAKSKKMEKDW